MRDLTSEIVIMIILALALLGILYVFYAAYRLINSEEPYKALRAVVVLWSLFFFVSLIFEAPAYSCIPFAIIISFPGLYLFTGGRQMSYSTEVILSSIGCLANVIIILDICGRVMGKKQVKRWSRQQEPKHKDPWNELEHRRSTPIDTSRVAKHLAEAHVGKSSPDLTTGPIEGVTNLK